MQERLSVFQDKSKYVLTLKEWRAITSKEVMIEQKFTQNFICTKLSGMGNISARKQGFNSFANILASCIMTISTLNTTSIEVIILRLRTLASAKLSANDF